MVVGAIAERVDVVVIGSGPGGYVAALRAAQSGLDVALVERQELGGTCLNVGCIPSKTVIEAANVADAVRSGHRPGVSADPLIDMGKLSEHIGATSARLRAGVNQLLADAGVGVHRGTANFVRPDRVIVAEGHHASHIDFDHAIVATGSRPIELPHLCFGGPVLDSTQALKLDTLPRSAAVVGAGYIGVELGTALAKLGTNVTIVESADTVLPLVTAPLTAPVHDRLVSLGVDVRTTCRALGYDDGVLDTDTGDRVAVDVVIVAVGRRPNSDTCSIEASGALVDVDGYVEVDRDLRAATGVFAIGDLVRGPALAHRASRHAEQAVSAIIGEPAVAPTAVAEVIYSDPEILSVGVGLDRASDLGHSVHRFPHAAAARAHTYGATTGSTWVVADREQTVVGVHAVGPHASELAGEAALAIEMAATLTDLCLTVHAHPTMGETIAEAAWLAAGSPLHVSR